MVEHEHGGIAGIETRQAIPVWAHGAIAPAAWQIGAPVGVHRIGRGPDLGECWTEPGVGRQAEGSRTTLRLNNGIAAGVVTTNLALATPQIGDIIELFASGAGWLFQREVQSGRT